MKRFGRSKISGIPTAGTGLDRHPAFQLGTFFASQLTDWEQQVADWLNQSQHRIGFRIRNGLLALAGFSYLLYFIALLAS
jgi:hypothetical protein